MALAPQIANVGTMGQDARYDTTGLEQIGGGYTTDGTYVYDPNGLSTNRPNDYVDGLPAANDHRADGSYGPGGSGGGGGGFGGDLTANPYYQQYMAQMQATDAADLSGVKSALQQLLIQFGLVPQGFQDKYGALDDTIKQLIQKNTDTGISAYARLLQQKDDAQRAAIQNLAKRGLTHSGEKGFDLRRGTLDWNRSYSDALNTVLGSANQLQTGYAGRQMDRQTALTQFLAQLASQVNMFNSTRHNPPAARPPSVPRQQPQVNPMDYWQSNPAPTYTSPTTGNNWYGGVNGIESTRFPGKAEDSLY